MFIRINAPIRLYDEYVKIGKPKDKTFFFKKYMPKIVYYDKKTKPSIIRKASHYNKIFFPELFALNFFLEKGYEAHIVEPSSFKKHPRYHQELRKLLEKLVEQGLMKESQRKVILEEETGIPDLFIYKGGKSPVWSFFEVKQKRGKYEDKLQLTQKKAAKEFFKHKIPIGIAEVYVN